MRVERFMYFCIKNYIGTQAEDLSTDKLLLVVYATDHSNVVECVTL